MQLEIPSYCCLNHDERILYFTFVYITLIFYHICLKKYLAGGALLRPDIIIIVSHSFELWTESGLSLG